MAIEREELLIITARVMALEYVVKHLLWNQAVRVADQHGEDEEGVARELTLFAESCGADLELSTVGNADPATSDHVAALVSEFVQQLVSALLRERGIEPHEKR